VCSVEDRIEILKHSDDKYLGKIGKIIQVRKGIRQISQPADTNSPKLEIEARYDVFVENNGKIIYNLRDTQLRKV
jgi:hypothetical protein